MSISRKVVGQEGKLPSKLLIGLTKAVGSIGSPAFNKLHCKLVEVMCAALGEDAKITLQLSDRSKMQFASSDRFWMRMFLPRFEHEASIRRLLELLKDVDYAFIDGGANIGYWSILASENPHNAVIAVEPVPMTFEMLTDNCRINEDRFVCVRNAIGNVDGAEAQMVIENGGKRHLGARVVEGEAKLNNTQKMERVETISLDTVYREHGKAHENVVLKLDIEGQETEALGAAGEVMRRQPLIIYEDHGKEPDSENSRFVMQQLGQKVFYMDAGGQLRRIVSLDDVKQLKTDKTYGYDFFAVTPDSAFDEILGRRAA